MPRRSGSYGAAVAKHSLASSRHGIEYTKLDWARVKVTGSLASVCSNSICPIRLLKARLRTCHLAVLARSSSTPAISTYKSRGFDRQNHNLERRVKDEYALVGRFIWAWHSNDLLMNRRDANSSSCLGKERPQAQSTPTYASRPPPIIVRSPREDGCWIVHHSARCVHRSSSQVAGFAFTRSFFGCLRRQYFPSSNHDIDFTGGNTARGFA